MTTAYRFGRFELSPATRQLLVDGKPTALGARAFDVLLVLIERRERLVRKDELFDLAWPGLVVEENNLQVQISFLRKILGDGIIETVPGHGYRFAAELVPLAEALPDVRRDNLPRALTRFIGHDADLEEYERIVATNRLVTLTGIGGCGKTRLAIEIATRLLPKFAHGAWFVDLAPMADPDRLPSTVARTLGLTERPGQPVIETLFEHLSAQQMLLLLDNCEHLVGACAGFVATVLGRASELRVLATSREALDVPGEQTLRVRSLSYPPPVQQGGSVRVEAFEAVQLFVDRARLAQPDFTLDATAAPAVAEICRRLDGLPLAIELATARTKVCSVSELRKMLDDRFSLLIGGSKMVPPRQQTLLATIKWSFDLLTPDERHLLESLSIFSGGWTLESAVAVAGDHAEQYAVLEQLSQLVDKSLIATIRSQSDATRYTMLETVRQYGLDSLAAAGAEATAGRHLEYFVTLAERLEPSIRNEQTEALEQLVPELENLAQALHACERLPGGPELGLRLVAALGQYWLALGLLELGYRLTTEALSWPDAQGKSPTRARALFVATRFAAFLGRYREAQDLANECLALARLLHDDHLEAGTLVFLGQTTIELGDVAQGIAFLEESLHLARECGDDEHVVRALNTLGGAHGDLGNLDLASQLFEEGLQIARDRRHFHATASVASNLAWIYVSLGQLERAWPLVLEALDLSSQAKSKWTMEVVLEVVVRLVAAVQDWPAAARMLGAEEAAAKLLGRKQQYPDRSSVVAGIRNSLSTADFETAYDAGHALSLEQAIGEARAWIEQFAPSAPGVVVEFRRRVPSVGRR